MTPLLRALKATSVSSGSLDDAARTSVIELTEAAEPPDLVVSRVTSSPAPGLRSDPLAGVPLRLTLVRASSRSVAGTNRRGD